jgi:hypothetical protein
MEALHAYARSISLFRKDDRRRIHGWLLLSVSCAIAGSFNDTLLLACLLSMAGLIHRNDGFKVTYSLSHKKFIEGRYLRWLSLLMYDACFSEEIRRAKTMRRPRKISLKFPEFLTLRELRYGLEWWNGKHGPWCDMAWTISGKCSIVLLSSPLVLTAFRLVRRVVRAKWCLINRHVPRTVLQ